MLARSSYRCFNIEFLFSFSDHNPQFGGYMAALKKSNYVREAENTAKQHRKIQLQVASADKRNPKQTAQHAMQAGARKYPEKMPRQHLVKPGIEDKLKLEPMCDAPYYKGSEKLKNKVAIITGGDSGIGRAVAILYAREGADVAIIYLNEHKDAKETKRMIEAASDHV